VDAPHKRETPHPSELGGEKGDGAEVSRATPECARGDDTRAEVVTQYRRDRWWLQGQIAQLCRADARAHFPEIHANRVHRVVGCSWIRVDDLSHVRPAGRTSMHYKGLMTCGSVWSCPICAAKIQERRRQEVEQLTVWMLAHGKSALMVSYTFPHNSDQSLAQLLEWQAHALRRLRTSKGYRKIKERIAYSGMVRSLEVTHGDNGWHPHTHELLVCAPDVPAQWLQHELTKLWMKACLDVGIPVPDEVAFYRHAVDVTANAAGDYLAKMDDQTKWGISHELTKSSSKQGRRNGSHPFKLASKTSTGHHFIEYVHAMKGKRQLYWSDGLKARVGVDEKSDEELAEEQVARVDLAIDYHPEAWAYVVGNDARNELTEAAEKGGAIGAYHFLRQLGFDHPTEYCHATESQARACDVESPAAGQVDRDRSRPHRPTRFDAAVSAYPN
jgi:hypothetical protein